MADPNTSLQPDVDRAIPIITMYSSQCLISAIVVILRFRARISIKRLGWDDFSMAMTWVSLA